MADKGRSFEFSSYVEPETVARYLESLAQQIRSGSARLSAGAESINLRFGSPVKLEIEAEMNPRKGKGSIELELSWRQTITADSGNGIVIEDAFEEEEREGEPALTVGEEEE
ncbi:MAG: amphi-Trp domain-containing protein [Chloroflexi bacterium]|nr:amphi-Trp domain-containing protein [Chloroflexota bacterium]